MVCCVLVAKHVKHLKCSNFVLHYIVCNDILTNKFTAANVLSCIHFSLQVLSYIYCILFLFSPITDLMLLPPKEKSQIPGEIALVAGIHCDMDSTLT